ncbi:GspH/FimT family pseudopilin [Salinicola endophyticus]|uniref:Type II secretion system protein H n=1 Tax=Salinicola endophyticus TaxID=1949083 RepID=A0AB74UGT1_9GAMM
MLPSAPPPVPDLARGDTAIAPRTAHRPSRAPTASSRSSGSRQGGFTLIELLVTLVIIGILAGIAISTSGWLERRRLASETEALHQRLEALQQLAIATRQPWQLCALGPAGASGQCGKNWNRGYQWAQADGGGGRLAGEHPLTGISLSWNRGSRLTFPSTPWRFNTSLGSFWVCTASDGNKLTLNDAGRVTLTHGERSGCPP